MEFIKAFIPYKSILRGGNVFIFKGREIVQISVHSLCRIRVSFYLNSYHRLHIWAPKLPMIVLQFNAKVAFVLLRSFKFQHLKTHFREVSFLFGCTGILRY